MPIEIRDEAIPAADYVICNLDRLLGADHRAAEPCPVSDLYFRSLGKCRQNATPADANQV
jgi:hypothetical protein